MVLLVSYSGVLGGAERVTLDVAAALEGERCLACPEGALAQAARDAGVRVFPLRERSPRLRGRGARALLDLAGHARETRALVRALAPELVIASGMRSALALTARPLPARVVFHHHDRLPSGALGALVRRAARRADLTIAVADGVAREIDPRGRLGARLVVVEPGVDVERFATTGPPARPHEVLVLGALVGWKRPGLALDVVALARRSLPDLRVRLAGAPLDGDDVLAALRARAARPDLAGAVEIAGPVDAAAALARAGCLLHCAEREPFGLAVLEALAAGRPVVAPEDAGAAAIVDGGGRLYPPGDAAAAAAALVEILSDPERARRLGAAARERARGHDGDRARARLREALAPLLGAGPGPARSGIALVTVAHDSALALPALLASAARHLPGARIVVADCASGDESVAVARAGGATVLELGENLGFGRACNRALAEVSEPVTILVNPDVELLDGSLAGLAAQAQTTGHLLAPVLVTPAGGREASVHPEPSSALDLVRALVPPAFLRSLAPERARRPRRVGWAVGACLAARTEVLRDLGPFDEQIFMYAEDMDLGLRAARAGVETWLWPEARVLHHGAHATSAAFGGEPFDRLARARHDVVARRLGPRRARLDDAAQTMTFASRIALKALARRPHERERRQLAAVRGRGR